jgi:hypothetical protein
MYATYAKMKEKEKDLHGLGRAHNEANPYKDSAQMEKEVHCLYILHQESRSISKTIKVLPPFISL